jgi:hypothetical protein
VKTNFSRKKLGILTFISLASILVVMALALNQNAPASSQNNNQSGLSNPQAQLNPHSGTGILYVYTNPERTTEATQNPAGNYIVLYDVTYYFKIVGITEYSEGSTINVWAHYQTDTTENNILIGSFNIESGGTIVFDWTIPTDIPFETAIKFKYGTSLTGPESSWYFAKKTTEGVRLSFVIPEVSFGSLGAIIALFSGLGITAFCRKKRV